MKLTMLTDAEIEALKTRIYTLVKPADARLANLATSQLNTSGYVTRMVAGRLAKFGVNAPTSVNGKA